MPILKSEYRPLSYLFNRHLQTVAPFFWVKPDNTMYQTEKLELPDGDFLELDWIRGGHNKLMILCHGLEGNSRSHYVQQMAWHFSALGWDILAMNVRGCGREMNRLPVLYHGGSTDDVDAVVSEYSSKYSSVVLVGFSLGANMFLNYAARHTTAPSLKAVATFSVPCDLRRSEQQVDKFIHHFYVQKFLDKLKKKVRKLETRHPGIADVNALDGVKSMQAFTAQFAVPCCGFDSVDDYYSAGSCLNSLAETNLPTLVVNAQNDPFLSGTCYPLDLARTSDYVFLDMPKRGGHSAFPITKTESWMPIRVEEFLREVLGS